MTGAGLAVDALAVAFVAGLVFMEARRGGLRALLDFGALVLTLVVLPLLARPVLTMGGGLLTLAGAALVLMVVALLASGWLGRRLQRARRGGEAVASEGNPRPTGSSRVVGGLVGLVTGVIIVGSVGMLLVTMRLTSPELEPVTTGSQTVRAAGAFEPTVRRLLFDTAQEPGESAPGTAETPGVTPTGGENPGGGADPGAASTSAASTSADQTSVPPPDGTAAGGSEAPTTATGSDGTGGADATGEAGVSSRVAALAELRSIQAITEDPQLMEAIEQGNYSVMLNHPKLLELWQDPRFRRFVAHVDTAELVAESEAMKQLADDYEAALTAFHAGELEAALAAADRVAAADQSYGRILILRGQILKQQGKLRDAAMSWQQAGELYTSAAEPAYLLGELAADFDQTARALAYYTQAIERDPGFHYAVHNRGILLFQTGNFLPAIVDLRSALEIHPEDPALRSSLDGALAGLARESNELVTSKRRDAELWPSLYAWHRQLVEQAPDELVARNAMALVLYIGAVEHEMADRVDEALAEVEAAARLAAGKDDRIERELSAWRGILLLRADRAAEAVATLRPLLAEGRLHLVYSADVFTELAIHAARRGRKDRARELFGVAMGALSGTSHSTRLMREKYERADPGAEIPPREELVDYVPGVRYTFREARGPVTYSPAEGSPTGEQPSELQPGDRLVEIEYVAPLWPSEVRELLIAATRSPPVTLTIARDEETLEVVIASGYEHLDWETAFPFTLPERLPD